MPDKLELSPDKIYVFDKGYNNCRAFKKLMEGGTGFGARVKDNAAYKMVEPNEMEEYMHVPSGIKHG